MGETVSPIAEDLALLPWRVEDAYGKAEDDPGPSHFCFSEVRRSDGETLASSWGDKDQPRAHALMQLIAAAPETAAERDRLREANAELVAALRFYAQEWDRDVFGDVGDPDRFFAVVSPTNSLREDKGLRARAALSKAEGR